jgi:hypothetical protein
MLKTKRSPYNGGEQIGADYYVFLKLLHENSIEKVLKNSIYLLLAVLFKKETQIGKFDFCAIGGL